MCTLITAQKIWAAKPSDNILKDEACGCLYNTIFHWCSFWPLRQVFCGCNNLSCVGSLCKRLIGPTKSISHLSNGSNVVAKKSDNSSLLKGFSVCWKTSQHLCWPFQILTTTITLCVTLSAYFPFLCCVPLQYLYMPHRGPWHTVF